MKPLIIAVRQLIFIVNRCEFILRISREKLFYIKKKDKMKTMETNSSSQKSQSQRRFVNFLRNVEWKIQGPLIAIITVISERKKNHNIAESCILFWIKFRIFFFISLALYLDILYTLAVAIHEIDCRAIEYFNRKKRKKLYTLSTLCLFFYLLFLLT